MSTASKRKFVNVSLMKMSQGVSDLRLPWGATLETALVEGGLGDQSLQSILEGVRVNGRPAELTQKLKEGDFITVSPQVKGGR